MKAVESVPGTSLRAQAIALLVTSLSLMLSWMPASLTAQEPGSTSGGGASVEGLGWMAGCWVVQGGGAVQEEVWLAPRGGVMLGVARSTRGDESIGHEYLRIESREGGLVFTASPSGQATAEFDVTRAEDGFVRVENPEHDFPQAIEYRSVERGLLARVFASTSDSAPAFEIPYRSGACPGDG